MKCRSCHKECQKIEIKNVTYWWCIYCKLLQEHEEKEKNNC